MPSIPPGFPSYGKCAAKKKLDELRRLTDPNLFASQFIDARSAARLLAVGLRSYRTAVESGSWGNHALLSAVPPGGHRLGVVLSALFDLVCNIEYLHGRVTNAKWIYCHTSRDVSESTPYAYFCFLKQCPRCCLDHKLGPRLEGAQHKPTSHHIGEITTTAMALVLRLLSAGTPMPVNLAVVSKQSHDVDAVAYRSNLLVLLEFKASPMVTFPLRAKLSRRMTKDGPDGPVEVPQHALVTIDHSNYPLTLYLPHVDVDIPLPRVSESRWPYTDVTAWLSQPDQFLRFLSGWLEIFTAYSVPKTQRTGRDVGLAYLANGWGDDIDSNKTKPGLGRTDDIKKGTYQLLKYGAYYRDGCPDLDIRGALVSNLDPLFMFDDYLAKLVDVRWAKSHKFEMDPAHPELLRVADKDLLYLYDAVIALNRPIVNDPLLRGCFDPDISEASLMSGGLDALLTSWENG